MTSIEVVPCPECGVPFGEHTLAEYRAHTAVDVPFQPAEDPVEFAPVDRQIIVDHVDVASMVVTVPTDGDPLIVAGIEFRFHNAQAGVPLTPILFMADDASVFKGLRKLVSAACDAAPMRAQQELRRLQRERRANP